MTIELNQQLAALSPEDRRHLLTRLRTRRGEDTPAPRPDRRLARRADPAAPAPLSFAQERLWFLDRVDPGNPAYNIAFAIRITGPLEHADLHRALVGVVRRHETLRSAFTETGPAPQQVVLADDSVALPSTDLRSTPAAQQPDAVRRLAAEHAATRFDLTQGRPFAMRLLALGQQEHLLLVVVHHIVFDGWSTAVFMDDLVAGYQPDQTAPVAELAVQFADWADWERRNLAGADFDRQLDYWKATLADAPIRSTIRPDHARPAVQAHQGAHQPVELDTELTSALTDLVPGATLNAVVIAGFAALLHRLTGQREVLLGVPTAGRTHAELEPLIGNVANTVVLRVDLTGDPTPRQLIDRVQTGLREALAHQDVPYASVVEAIAPPRTLRHNPLFQIMFSIADLAQHPRVRGATVFAFEQLGGEASDFDLFFALNRDDGQVSGQVAYDTRLYLPGTVRETVAGLREVLTEFVAHPDRPATPRRAPLSVAATFTADPVGEPLNFWFELLRLPTDVRIAPYGQVVQTLLQAEPDVPTAVLLRWEDWLPARDPDIAPDTVTDVLDAALADLLRAIGAFRARSGAPLLIGITPPSAAFARQPWAGLFAALEEGLVSHCATQPANTVFGVDSWSRRYPNASVLDAQADLLGHIPYTAEFFAALATGIARDLHARRARPIRAIALPHELAQGREWRRELARQQRFGRRALTYRDPAEVPELIAEANLDPLDCLVVAPGQAPSARVIDAPDPAILAQLWLLDPPMHPGGTLLVNAERLVHIATELTDMALVATRSRTAPPIAALEQELVPPRDERERHLAALWSEILQREPGDVGVTANFFASGGHSLLATRLLSQVYAAFGRHVPLAEFFADPTIEHLAALLADTDADEAIRPDPDAPPELSATQQRLWALAQIGDDPARHNLTFAATLRGPLDVAALRSALADVVRRHAVLRTRFVEVDGTPVAEIADPGTSAQCWLPEMTLPGGGARLSEHIAEFASQVYDLRRGPLLRAQLVITGPDEHQLLLSTHHIVADNWSWGVLFDELTANYLARTTGTAAEPAPLPIQFADFAAWQRRWLAGTAPNRHEDYWRSALAGAPATLDLPADRPRPAARSDRAGRYTHAFDPRLGPALRTLSGAEQASLFSVLLAGFALLLHRFGHTDDVVVGTPVAGRNRPELDPLIGYFADVLPFRLDLSADPTFRELLRRVHQRVVSDFGHQELPFSRIVDAVAPRRDPAFHPVFQHMFSFLDQPEYSLSLPGIAVTELDVPITGTDFDLFLTLLWHGETLVATVDYSTDLFDPQTPALLVDSLHAVLTAALSNMDSAISALDAGAAGAVLAERARALRPDTEPVAEWPIAIAASFVAEPVRAALGHWLRRAGLPASVEFAPYAQVFQQLLDPAGQLGAAEDGVNVVLLRWEDWLRHQGDRAGDPWLAAVELERGLHSLCTALRTFHDRTGAPLLIGLCPPSAAYQDGRWPALLGGLAERLTRFSAELDGIHVADMSQWSEVYSVGEVCDARSDQLGHLPYTTEYYTALGTGIAREVRRLRAAPVRTLVIGPDQPGTDLTRFLYRQQRAGRTLVLCSSAESVWDPDRTIVGTATGSLTDQLAALVADGTVDPAESLVLATDSTELDLLAAAYPELIALPADTTSLRHVWLLDPPGPGSDRTPADLTALTTPITAAELVHVLADGTATARTVADYVAPRTERERTLASVWSRLLHRDRVGSQDNFFDLGGDSMTAIQVVSLAARAGVAITPRQLLTQPTLADLAEAAGQPAATVEYAPADDGPTPLTPPQQWFLEKIGPTLANPAHFNHPYYLELREPVTPQHLEQALRLLLAQHESLRLRFAQDEQGHWHQHHDQAAVLPFASHDLSGLDEPARAERMVALATDAQRGLDLATGPLVRAVHFRLGAHGPDRLLIVNHHLVVDAVSRAILLADLQTWCRQLAEGQQPTPLPRTTSYQRWSRRLADRADSAELRAELAFWQAQQRPVDTELPVDFPDGRTDFAHMRTIRTELSVPDTEAIRTAARQLPMKLGDFLVGVVGQVLSRRRGGGDVAVAVAGHGREPLFDDVDLARTTGWFQIYYPLVLPGDDADLSAARTRLAQVADNGIGYALLRYACADEQIRRSLAETRQPQVSVNFMGDFGFADTPAGTESFGVPTDDFGPAEDGSGEWPYLIDVVPAVVGGRLVIELNYSVSVHREETVRSLLNELVERLVQISQPVLESNEEMSR